jgi:DNA-binding LytR/AlgR family response regulator
MQKIKCILLDDELTGLKYLKMLCEAIPFIQVVKCYSSSEKLLAEHQSLQYDLCLLDINMPGVNGLEVAQLLEDKQVIFVSAYPEFAVNAFEIEAIDFIRKPVEKIRLEKALTKVQKLIQEKNIAKEYINWNTNLGKSVIFFEDLLFIATSEDDKRDKLAYIKDGQTMLFKNITLERLVSELPANNFIQVNRAEIISRKAIQSHTADEIILKAKDEMQRPISVTLGDAYRKAFYEWVK